MKYDMYFNYSEKLAVKNEICTPQRGVSLKEGLFKKVFDNNIEFLKTLDMDAMLYWFRKNSGRPSPGEPYHGHFEDNIKGQTAGMYLMGAGNVLKWQEDDGLRKTMDCIIDCIEECSDSDGYLLPIPKRSFGTREYPHYVRIWLNYGLAAAGFAGNQKAFGMLRRWQDWFNSCGELPIIKYLELSYQGIVASTSVYATPAGTWDDIDTAMKYYEEDWRLAQFIFKERDAVHTRKQPGREPHPHGTELESFEGYLDLYRATGRFYYLNAVMGAYELYKEDWQHPGGGIVLCENFDAYPGCYWIRHQKPYNELCCTSFWINLNQRLHWLYPTEERYVNEIEQSLYNICIADQEDNRGIRYFAWLDIQKCESKKVTCCCGVGTRIYGSLPEYLYSVDGDGIYADIYAASTFVWRHGENTIRVETDTDMPYVNVVQIGLSGFSSDRFKLRLRIPSWVAGGKVAVCLNNGEVFEGIPGTYIELDRIWRGGDTLEFKLPMTFRWYRYTGADQISGYERYCYMYGPLLYAFEGELRHSEEGSYMYLEAAHDRLPECIIKGDKPLTYFFKGVPGLKLVPYFSIGDELFTCYPCFKC